MKLAVCEIQKDDIQHIVRYWLESGDIHMTGMGVDLKKMPSRERWEQMLSRQVQAPLHEKQSFCMIWLIDGLQVGHCNINGIEPGGKANMHLHLWHSTNRQKGVGTQFVKLSLPHFFKAYNLQRVICEPYALNPAPNKVLARVGFTFVKQYVTTPGFLNFEQPVKQWLFEASQLDQL